MIEDGTARSVGVLLYLEVEEDPLVRTNRPLQAKLWKAIEIDAKAGDETALLAASLLTHGEAIAAVTARLSEP
jgi:hypothetical protein